jgi:hypothetical protein
LSAPLAAERHVVSVSPQRDRAVVNGDDDHRQPVTALVNKLVTAGLLTPDDARTVRPMIELRIDDRRGEQTPTLPAVTDLPANVRVVK